MKFFVANMNFIWRLCLIILLLLLELSLLTFLLPRYLVPNLLLVSLVIWLIILSNFKTVLILAFIAGLILDFFSGLAFGVSALSFLITIFLLQIIKTRFFTKPTFWQKVFLILAASIFYWLFTRIEIQFLPLVALSDFRWSFSWIMLFIMIGQLIANLIFGLGLYFLLKKLEKQ